MKWPRGCTVIECEEIQLDSRSMFFIKEFEDFIWLLGTLPTVFKLKNSYYIMGDTYAYIYSEKQK